MGSFCMIVTLYLELMIRPRPETHSRDKRFKDAVAALVGRVWGETVAGLIERSWTSTCMDGIDEGVLMVALLQAIIWL
ncbi:hypothetical protein PVK06_048094 [Gossypium arboreum]|uniref:Uncharacterized protein n=1 Tax=Gossypium arboreum TaxID=29729 RepID=A0ABR0MFH4_GOSAR|nr:hypothetical protein PVK06_048094 [Gossypium arboreum]